MVAFAFTGQGAQRTGMGRGWEDEESWEIVARASDVSGRDVAGLLLDAGPAELRLTHNAQLAMLVFNLVADDSLRRTGIVPRAVLGHSVGEYAALISAGVLDFDDGVRLVVERADAMREADQRNPGTMAAIIGLDDDDAAAACSRADGDVWVANYNAPNQTVVAGSHDGVRLAEKAALDLGADRVIHLDVGGAYHTQFMVPAQARLRAALAQAEWRPAEVPVVANVDGRARASSADWPALLSAQLCSPVRWAQSVRRLASLDVDTIVHIGPRRSLARLAKRSAPEGRVVTVREPADVDVVLAMSLGGFEGLDELDALGELSERLHMSERLVVSPATGIYKNTPVPSAVTTGGEILAEGDVVGVVGEEPVRSPFAGWLMGMLATDGQRVRKGQPIAWLRLLSA